MAYENKPKLHRPFFTFLFIFSNLNLEPLKDNLSQIIFRSAKLFQKRIFQKFRLLKHKENFPRSCVASFPSDFYKFHYYIDCHLNYISAKLFSNPASGISEQELSLNVIYTFIVSPSQRNKMKI